MTEHGHLRLGWSLAVDAVALEGSFATFSVMPEGVFSSEGCTGILPDNLVQVWSLKICFSGMGICKRAMDGKKLSRCERADDELSTASLGFIVPIISRPRGSLAAAWHSRRASLLGTRPR